MMTDLVDSKRINYLSGEHQKKERNVVLKSGES